jgi:CxxC motif-containing protein (DUF1111 family)
MRSRLVIAIVGLTACTDRTEPTSPNERERPAPSDVAPSFELKGEKFSSRFAHTALSGGATTVFDATANAFSLPAPNLAGLALARHDAGDVAFELQFDQATGLGPVFDNIACESCHEGDGRGRPPTGSEIFESLLFRTSLKGRGPMGGPQPIPNIGTQLQLRSVPGMLPDASASLAYHDSSGVLPNGTPFTLQVPQYILAGARSPLPGGTLVSPRVAPFVFGLGLLEAVPEAEVVAIALAQRLQGQVSGRPNYVWDAVHLRVALGRFGWKANVPNLLHQTAGAYNGDIGITSTIFPAESCQGADPLCNPHPPEIANQTVGDVAFYTETLGVPARRDLGNPLTDRGEILFHQSGCASCHVSTLQTGFLPNVPQVSNQLIHPYTDLLVHDMGPALADNRPDFQAGGREWRTPPLWGIGLVQTVNGHTNFLHDGRARSLFEAILWHGGEATAARDRFKQLGAPDRLALVAFLSSL